MWKHYLADYKRFAVMGAVFLALFVPMFLFMPHAPWGFIGFWAMDPISYYMTMYKRILRDEALTRKNTPTKTP
jgi:hypothetical protein